MTIVGATQSTKEVVGFSAGFIADRGITESEYRYPSASRRSVDNFEYGGVVDNASDALGVNLNNPPPKEFNFIDKTNLIEMFRHHYIEYP
jgi:hypothetical protein